MGFGSVLIVVLWVCSLVWAFFFVLLVTKKEKSNAKKKEHHRYRE